MLNGCAALPPALNYIGYLKTGADGISYLATKKSVSDHLVSKVLDKDCALHRIISKNKVCKEVLTNKTLALYKDITLDVNPIQSKYYRKYTYYRPRYKVDTYARQNSYK